MRQDYFEPGFVYHVYNRGNNSEKLFLESKNYEYFILKARYYLSPVGNILAYCLLPNHFHFLIQFKDENSLPGITPQKISKAFSNLFNSYARSFNLHYERKGRLFQEHPKRHRVIKDDYFKSALVYIHTNPVHHDLTQEYSSYPWSSIKEYRSISYFLIKPELSLKIFGSWEAFWIAHERKMGLLDVYE